MYRNSEIAVDLYNLYHSLSSSYIYLYIKLHGYVYIYIQTITYVVRCSANGKKHIPMTLLLVQKSCCSDSLITKCGF